MKKKYTYSDIEKKINNDLDNESNDNLKKISKKVDQVKDIMHENIIIAIQNTEKIEDIELKTEELERDTGIFRDNSKKLKDKMLWKK